MVVGDLTRGTLRVVPLPVTAPDRPAGLILPRARTVPPAGRAFVSCLRAYVAELADLGIAKAITCGEGGAARHCRRSPAVPGFGLQPPDNRTSLLPRLARKLDRLLRESLPLERPFGRR
jgi:hypothetical protein